MEMKKLHMGTMSFGSDTMDEVVHQLETAFGATHARQGSLSTGVQLATRGRRDMSARIRDVVLSLALCHNVRSWLFFAVMTDNPFPGHSRYQ
jgi:phospholipid-translocating ATPase